MNEAIRKILEKILGAKDGIELFVPEHERFGHYSTNIALRLAKTKGVPPLELAASLARDIERSAPKGFFERVEAAQPGFVNFWLTPASIRKEFDLIAKKGEKFGRSAAHRGERVIVEYSQPNIAKRMHVGHLRTTVLGDAIANLHEFLGYRVVRWNYLGDWGTQFGKLIAAYKLWGNKAEVQKNPIQTLLDLYVRFHDEIKKDPALEDRGREEFKKLEDGDRENLALWRWFKRESLKEFARTYKRLGVRFDTEIGESFFEKEIPSLVAELLQKGIAKHSEGAVVVPLEQFGLPSALVRKSDGATLYLSRDIANLRYRLKKYRPHKILYVVGNEQALHFEQLFRVAETMGLGKGIELAHIKYGLVLAEGGKKFATREGRVVFLEDVLEKANELARKIVEEKNKALPEKEKAKVAHAVAIGALKYANLKENRHSDIVFNWETMLDFSGDSAPYLQYTYARFRSILRRAGRRSAPGKSKFLDGEKELALVRALSEFPNAVAASTEAYAPNHLAAYLYRLAALANKFYEATPIVKDADAARRGARLALVRVVASVLKTGVGLLGIEVIERI